MKIYNQNNIMAIFINGNALGVKDIFKVLVMSGSSDILANIACYGVVLYNPSTNADLTVTNADSGGDVFLLEAGRSINVYVTANCNELTIVGTGSQSLYYIPTIAT